MRGVVTALLSSTALLASLQTADAAVVERARMPMKFKNGVYHFDMTGLHAQRITRAYLAHRGRVPVKKSTLRRAIKRKVWKVRLSKSQARRLGCPLKRRCRGLHLLVRYRT